MSPPLAAASLAALKCMQREPQRIETLQARGQFFLSQAKAAGVDTGTSAGYAVIPAITGSSLRATRLALALFERGINVMPIIYPAVPEKSARLRFFISCSHTEEQIKTTVHSLAELLKDL
jgi:8-amino-7-oxononanoate synthase